MSKMSMLKVSRKLLPELVGKNSPEGYLFWNDLVIEEHLFHF